MRERRVARAIRYLRSRRALAAGLGVICSIAAALAAVPFAQRYFYVVKATDEISAIYYKSGPLSDADTQTVAQLACEALSNLSRDANFRADLTQLAARRPGYQKQIEDMRTNLAEFITKFLIVEKDQLLKENFDRRLIDATLFQLELSRAQLASRAVDVDAQINQIGALANAACKLADKLKRGTRDKAIADAALTALVQGLGGVMLVAADAGAEGLSDGAATPIADISAEAGFYYIGEAVRITNELIEFISAG